MDTKGKLLELIYKYAHSKDTVGVNYILSLGLNYNDACAYSENVHQDYITSKFIRMQAHCYCGNVAIKWIPKPICPNCRFKNSLKSIEYG